MPMTREPVRAVPGSCRERWVRAGGTSDLDDVFRTVDAAVRHLDAGPVHDTGPENGRKTP